MAPPVVPPISVLETEGLFNTYLVWLMNNWMPIVVVAAVTTLTTVLLGDAIWKLLKALGNNIYMWLPARGPTLIKVVGLGPGGTEIPLMLMPLPPPPSSTESETLTYATPPPATALPSSSMSGGGGVSRRAAK